MAQNHKTTHRTTDGHGDSMTELAQCGRFSENQTMPLQLTTTAIFVLIDLKYKK